MAKYIIPASSTVKFYNLQRIKAFTSADIATTSIRVYDGSKLVVDMSLTNLQKLQKSYQPTNTVLLDFPLIGTSAEKLTLEVINAKASEITLSCTKSNAFKSHQEVYRTATYSAGTNISLENVDKIICTANDCTINSKYVQDTMEANTVIELGGSDVEIVPGSSGVTLQIKQINTSYEMLLTAQNEQARFNQEFEQKLSR